MDISRANHIREAKLKGAALKRLKEIIRAEQSREAPQALLDKLNKAKEEFEAEIVNHIEQA